MLMILYIFLKMEKILTQIIFTTSVFVSPLQASKPLHLNTSMEFDCILKSS